MNLVHVDRAAAWIADFEFDPAVHGGMRAVKEPGKIGNREIADLHNPFEPFVEFAVFHSSHTIRRHDRAARQDPLTARMDSAQSQIAHFAAVEAGHRQEPIAAQIAAGRSEAGLSCSTPDQPPGMGPDALAATRY